MTNRLLLTVLLLAASLYAQEPVAELPRVYIDTTYSQPQGGTTWAAHNPEDLTSAIAGAQPGDVIVLDAGVTYSGRWILPQKANPNGQWIYVVSSALATLPEGVQVSPADAVNMPKLQTVNVAAVFQVSGGVNHWRFAGLELTSASMYNPNPAKWPGMGYAYFLIGSQSNPLPVPDSLTVDRCYIHGSPTQDIVTAIQGSATNYAVVDSYISDIHAPGQDSQAFGASYTTGPVKIDNNYLEAAGENIMFGGSGGNSNPGVPSDITITRNYLKKPLAWACNTGVGCTVGPGHQWVEKNAFELKSAQRVLFDGNTIENVWAGGQTGFAILLTPRTAQSGDFAVVNDITITNNTLINVSAGINGGPVDYQCGVGRYTECLNAGSADRWVIANNAITSFYDPALPGGIRNLLMTFSASYDNINQKPGLMHDVVLANNTMPKGPSSGVTCWDSIFFSAAGQKTPLPVLYDNIWITSNTLCRAPFGDYGLPPSAWMATPASPSFAVRYTGNTVLP